MQKWKLLSESHCSAIALYLVSGKMLVEVALVISQAGFCCSYLIYISETLSSLSPFSRIQILLLAMPLLMVMALIKVTEAVPVVDEMRGGERRGREVEGIQRVSV